MQSKLCAKYLAVFESMVSKFRLEAFSGAGIYLDVCTYEHGKLQVSVKQLPVFFPHERFGIGGATQEGILHFKNPPFSLGFQRFSLERKGKAPREASLRGFLSLRQDQFLRLVRKLPWDGRPRSIDSRRGGTKVAVPGIWSRAEGRSKSL